MHWNQAVSGFDVNLSQESPGRVGCDHLRNVVHRCVPEAAKIGVNAVVDTLACWVREIRDEAPLPRVPALGDDPEPVHVAWGKVPLLGRREGA